MWLYGDRVVGVIHRRFRWERGGRVAATGAKWRLLLARGACAYLWLEADVSIFDAKFLRLIRLVASALRLTPRIGRPSSLLRTHCYDSRVEAAVCVMVVSMSMGVIEFMAIGFLRLCANQLRLLARIEVYAPYYLRSTRVIYNLIASIWLGVFTVSIPLGILSPGRELMLMTHYISGFIQLRNWFAVILTIK